MGTINYKTSDYITMTTPNYNVDDFLTDDDFIEWCVENEYTDLTSVAYDEIEQSIQADYENAKSYLGNYDFYYYHVTVEPRYYDGWQIVIENNFSYCYDSYSDKIAARKEIAQIQAFLTDCAACGWVQCSPGWGMGYSDYKDTITAIKAACMEMRAENKSTPCWSILVRLGEV